MSKFEKFISSPKFVYVIAAYFFVMWLSKLELLGCIFAVSIMCLLLLTQKSAQISLPFICLLIFGISLTDIPTAGFVEDDRFISQGNKLFFPIVAVLFVAIVLSLLYNLIKSKTFCKLNSKFLLPFGLAAASFLGAGMFSPNFIFGINLLLVAGYAFLAFIFVVVLTNIEGDKQGYVAHILIAAGIIMLAQMLVYYLQQDDVMFALRHKLIVVGWGLSNTIAVILALATPMSLYLYQSTQKIRYLALAFLFCVGILFTLSRGIIFICIIAFPLQLIYLAVKAKNLKKTLIAILVCCGICVLVVLAVGKGFTDIAAFRLNLDNSNRVEIWEYYMQIFQKYPVFGGGFFEKTTQGLKFFLPHSTIISLLSSTGIVGFCTFTIYAVWKYIILIKNIKTNFGFYALAASGTFAIYSFVDVSIYLLYQSFLLIAMLAATKKVKEEEV